MVKICIFEGCNKQSTYNNIGEPNAIYCKEHKEENMVDIKNKKCIFEE